MSTREIIVFRAAASSWVSWTLTSVRTQTEEQTAVRYIDAGHVGLASAVGRADLDALTASAKESCCSKPYSRSGDRFRMGGRTPWRIA